MTHHYFAKCPHCEKQIEVEIDTPQCPLRPEVQLRAIIPRGNSFEIKREEAK